MNKQEINEIRQEADRIDAVVNSEKKKKNRKSVKFDFKPRTRCQILFMTLEDPTFSPVSKAISTFIMVLILTGCVTQIMESMKEFQFVPKRCDRSRLNAKDCQRKPLREFYVVEVVCMIIFTIEYIARVVLVSCVPLASWLPQKVVDEKKENSGKKESAFAESMKNFIREDAKKVPKTFGQRLWVRWKYCTLPMNAIDAIAIIPFWLELTGLIRNRFAVVRIIRLTRVLRMLKSPSISNSVNVFYGAFAASLPALSILFFFSVLAIVLVGTMGYIFEQGEFTVDRPDLCCPNKQTRRSDRGEEDDSCFGCFLREKSDGVGKEPTPFTSIPKGMYWVVITITTVGYGDLYPTSPAGRLLAVVITYAGVLAIALPISVIGNNFTAHYERSRLEQKRRELKLLKTRQKVADRLSSVFSQVSSSFLGGGGAGARRGAAGSNQQEIKNPFNLISSALNRPKKKYTCAEREEIKHKAAMHILKTFREYQRRKRTMKVVPSWTGSSSGKIYPDTGEDVAEVSGEDDGNNGAPNSSNAREEEERRDAMMMNPKPSSRSVISSSATACDPWLVGGERWSPSEEFDESCDEAFDDDELSVRNMEMLTRMVSSLSHSVAAQQRTLGVLDRQLRLMSTKINYPSSSTARR